MNHLFFTFCLSLNLSGIQTCEIQHLGDVGLRVISKTSQTNLDTFKSVINPKTTCWPVWVIAGRKLQTLYFLNFNVNQFDANLFWQDSDEVSQNSSSESLDGNNIWFIYNMVGTENIILKLQIASCSVIYSLNQNLYKKTSLQSCSPLFNSQNALHSNRDKVDGVTLMHPRLSVSSSFSSSWHFQRPAAQT